mmetsp:Transcript_1010/g.1833  ORF Transcript_1010/g.1833 Transcript_1010/m.1833 type:complete len:215 (-) Transcript_1010:102-746(-)
MAPSPEVELRVSSLTIQRRGESAAAPSSIDAAGARGAPGHRGRRMWSDSTALSPPPLLSQPSAQLSIATSVLRLERSLLTCSLLLIPSSASASASFSSSSSIAPLTSCSRSAALYCGSLSPAKKRTTSSTPHSATGAPPTSAGGSHAARASYTTRLSRCSRSSTARIATPAAVSTRSTERMPRRSRTPERKRSHVRLFARPKRALRAGFPARER